MGRITEVAPADEAKIVDLLCREIDNARERITSEASWARLEQFFFEKLVQEKTALWGAQLVAWAEAGHPAAHRALRRYGREMKERSRFDDILVTVRAYLIKTDDQPFVPFPRGRHVVQNLMRNLWIVAVMQNAAIGTGVDPTRGASTATPSIAYFLARAMKRKGFRHTKERELNRIYWGRGELAAALEASMPRIALTASG